jgi:hypothetical protein
MAYGGFGVNKRAIILGVVALVSAPRGEEGVVRRVHIGLGEFRLKGAGALAAPQHLPLG